MIARYPVATRGCHLQSAIIDTFKIFTCHYYFFLPYLATDVRQMSDDVKRQVADGGATD